MPHTFEIKTGRWFNPAMEHIATGYAGGNCGKNPEGKNNPDMVNIPRVGPLPPGMYTLGTPVDHSQLGDFAIPLIPDPANEMFKRGGFYLHGDTKIPGNASEGCIIQGPVIRHGAHESPDQKVRVVKEL